MVCALMLWRPWSTRILEKKKMGMQSWLERLGGRRGKWKWWNHVKSACGSHGIDIVACGSTDADTCPCYYVLTFLLLSDKRAVESNGNPPLWQGKVNEDGIRLLRRLCVEVRSRHPGVLLSAEESTNFKWVSNHEPVAWDGSKTLN